MYFSLQTTLNNDPAAVSAKNYVWILDIVIFTDNVPRSGTHLEANELIVGFADQNLNNLSPGMLASIILHDGYHQWAHDNGQQSWGVDAEIAATQAQLSAASYTSLTQTEIQYLTDYMNNPAAIDARINTPCRIAP